MTFDEWWKANKALVSTHDTYDMAHAAWAAAVEQAALVAEAEVEYTRLPGVCARIAARIRHALYGCIATRVCDTNGAQDSQPAMTASAPPV